MDINEGIISLQEKTIKNLKAEITYWKETAKYYQDMISDMARKELNKTLYK